MGFFPDTIAAQLRGVLVRRDRLVFLDFLTSPMRLWTGFGTLHTNDGHDWSGVGQLGQIGDLESAIGGKAPQASFTLSGVDAGLISDTINASSEVKGRVVTVFEQFFDENWACLDNPYSVYTGLMDVMRIRQQGPAQCSIELTAETVFAKRAYPPLGTLSDRDQQRLFPGDDGLKMVPQMVFQTVSWPVILPQH